MNKKFIAKQFVKVYNDLPKITSRYSENDYNFFEFHKVNLNKIIVGVKSFQTSREFTEVYSFDLRNKSLIKLYYKTVLIDVPNEKNDSYNYLHIVADKKEDYFFVIDFKKNINWKINNKASDSICTSISCRKDYDSEKNLIRISHYDYSQSKYKEKEIINLNENSLMKFSTDNDYYTIDDFNAYDKDFNKIFTLDSENKKIIYLDLILNFKEFKITKNEYFVDNIIIKKANKINLVEINFRTKKNTKKRIAFYYDEETKEFINLTFKKGEYFAEKDPLNYKVYENKLYYIQSINGYTKEIFNFNKSFNYENENEIKINFDKKGFEFLSACVDNIEREIKYFGDFKTFSGGSNYTLIYSLQNKKLCIYDKKTKRILHFNYDKIMNELTNVNFFLTNEYYKFNNKNEKGDTVETIDGVFMNNKTIYFQTKKTICLESHVNYPHSRDLEKVIYFFDMKSNFIIKSYFNEDKKSIFNRKDLMLKHLFKKDKKMFMVNNIRMKMHYNQRKFNLLSN